MQIKLDKKNYKLAAPFILYSVLDTPYLIHRT